MNCTNCGARVDDSARFCPVCGHKLKSENPPITQESPQEEALSGEKSTYESIKNNENLIENQKAQDQPKEKESRIKRFVSSFSNKKTQEKQASKEANEQIADEIFENDNNYSHLNQKIEPEKANENDIPP